jgi:uroporphyrinogen III methyltransferase/synthase
MSKTVLITRPEGLYGGATQLASKIEELGFRSLVLPVLRCEPIELSAHEESLVRDFIAGGDGWVTFLSPTAVYIFRQVCEERSLRVDIPRSIKCAVQGTGTADALERCFGRRADFMPSVSVAEDFGCEFARELRKQSRVLVPQSADGRDVLAPFLRSKGHEVHSLNLYHTREVPLSPETLVLIERQDPTESVIVFMSPSAVRATVKAVAQQRSLLERIPVVSVGPITSQAVKAAGLRIAAEASSHSEEGIIEALLGFR